MKKYANFEIRNIFINISSFLLLSLPFLIRSLSYLQLVSSTSLLTLHTNKLWHKISFHCSFAIATPNMQCQTSLLSQFINIVLYLPIYFEHTRITALRIQVLPAKTASAIFVACTECQSGRATVRPTRSASGIAGSA